MLEALTKAVAQAGHPPAQDIPETLAALVPSGISIHDIAAASDGEFMKSGSNLWAIYAALSSAGHPIAHDPEDHAYLVKIASGVSDAIRPLLDIPSLDQDDTAYGSLAYRGETGLRILHVLLATYGLQPTPDMLIVAAAFTNKNDPWTTTLARDTAHALLQISLPTPDKRHSFIADTLLARFLRSRFSESRPATVTASGRKAEYVDSSRYDGRNALDDEMAIRPWKYREQYAISVLEWAVVESDKQLIQQSWNLFTPVLLTLLDDPQPLVKARGLEALRCFWSRCPVDLMQRTGLAGVFEQAVFPALLCLPDLTPEEESIRVLTAAYAVLLEMTGIPPLCAEGPAGSHTGDDDVNLCLSRSFTPTQQALLNKTVREGLLVGYHHAKEHVRMSQLFFDETSRFVNGMGVLAVRHLKDLVPMATGHLMDPFGTNHSPSLLASIRLLQSTLRSCWPQIPRYQDELIQGLMLCWLNVDEDSSLPVSGKSGSAALKKELQEAASMLDAILQAVGIDNGVRTAPLVRKEPKLEELFHKIAT